MNSWDGKIVRLDIKLGNKITTVRGIYLGNYYLSGKQLFKGKFMTVQKDDVNKILNLDIKNTYFILHRENNDLIVLDIDELVKSNKGYLQVKIGQSKLQKEYSNYLRNVYLQTSKKVEKEFKGVVKVDGKEVIPLAVYKETNSKLAGIYDYGIRTKNKSVKNITEKNKIEDLKSGIVVTLRTYGNLYSPSTHQLATKLIVVPPLDEDLISLPVYTYYFDMSKYMPNDTKYVSIYNKNSTIEENEIKLEDNTFSLKYDNIVNKNFMLDKYKITDGQFYRIIKQHLETSEKVNKFMEGLRKELLTEDIILDIYKRFFVGKESTIKLAKKYYKGEKQDLGKELKKTYLEELIINGKISDEIIAITDKVDEIYESTTDYDNDYEDLINEIDYYIEKYNKTLKVEPFEEIFSVFYADRDDYDSRKVVIPHKYLNIEVRGDCIETYDSTPRGYYYLRIEDK